MNEPRWSAFWPLAFGFAAVIVLMGGFGLWGARAEIAGAVIAPGKVEVDQNRQIVQHPIGGVVTKIAVQEGDLVEAGDVLIQLDTQQMLSRLAIINGQLAETLARRGRLEAERDGQDQIAFDPILQSDTFSGPETDDLMAGQINLFRARNETVAQQIAQLSERSAQTENQVLGIQAQERSVVRQLELIRSELTAQETLLERGLTQTSAVLALQREAASLEGRIGELSASKAQANQRITEIAMQVLGVTSQKREEAITQLRDLRVSELELTEERLALISDIAQMEIRAPVSGLVYDMQVKTMRSVVGSAQPVLFLIPQDRPLVIAARVEPTDIDQLVVGQPVNLRFPALDQRTTPELKGEVALVSADAFEDEAIGSTYYRVEIVLAKGEVDKLGANQTLLPGMPVEAFIRTEDRSPVQYLVKPMSDYFARAFREG